MDEQGYNGWKNYETWAVALWISNEQGSYNYSRELAAEEADKNDDYPTVHAASALQEWFEEDAPELEGAFADLLGAALQEVDWREIADDILSEIPACVDCGRRTNGDLDDANRCEGCADQANEEV